MRGSRSGERDTERFEIRRDAAGEDPYLTQIPDQSGMQIATKVLAKCGLIAAGRALAPKAFDLLDVGLVKPHLLVRGEREDPPQGAVQRPYREIFHLAPFRGRRFRH